MEFGKTKDGMVDYVEKIFTMLKGRNMPCKFIRCDNAGEPVGLQAVCEKYGVKLEYTPPYSPQYNGRIERRFAVVTQKAIAMMFDAGFNKEFRSKVWGEAVATAAFLGDIFPTQRSSIPAYNLFNKEDSKWYPFFIEYGRVGMVTSQKKGKKLESQGKPMIMVGYALQHKPGSYRMYNPDTGKVVVCDNIS